MSLADVFSITAPDDLAELMGDGTIAEWRPRWYRDAACREMRTAVFFRSDTALAQRVCKTCPVRQQCLDLALALPSLSGVWGGLTEDERRELRQGRRRAP